MKKIGREVLAGALSLALAGGGLLVGTGAEALVFCAKTNKPAKVKVRGDACKAGKETEVSLLDIPEVQAELDALMGQNQVVAYGSVYVLSSSDTCVLQNLNSANVMSATYDAAAEACDIAFDDFAFSIDTHVAVVSGSVPGAIVGHQGLSGALRVYARAAGGVDVPGGTLIQFTVLEP